MRISHFIPLRGKRIDIIREILSELGIRNECQLYAITLTDERHPTVILSAIPPQAWPSTYKLTVNLASGEGTFAEAVATISDMGINILASSTAATTTEGEGCWTATVQMQGQHTEEAVRKIKGDIEECLNSKSLLSSSSFYGSDLELVRLTPLKVLHRIHSLSASRNEYVGHVKNYFIDFGEFRDKNNANLYDRFIGRHYTDRAERAPDCCLVTPDTEERYLRITFLPYHAEMLLVSMRIEISSPNRQFSGYFGSVLRSIKSLRLNLYSSDNFLLEKSNSVDETGREVATFAFSVDARRAELPTEKQLRKQQIYEKVNKDLGALAETKEPKPAIELPEEFFNVSDVPSIFPRCFLATNARNNDESGKYAMKVIEALRSLRLQPVNTDITKMRTIGEDVNPLLKACPFVVSLHFPVSDNQLLTPEGGPTLPADTHTPSDWVLYEETYAMALGKRVYRMRHRAVRQPRYKGQDREFVFTQSTFQNELGHLLDAIEAFQTMGEYALAVRASDEIAAMIPPALLIRDLDGAYKPD